MEQTVTCLLMVQKFRNDVNDVNAKNRLIKVHVIKDFFWNPSNCECECDRSWDIGEYLN